MIDEEEKDSSTSEHVNLILAIMQVESGGKVADVMQSSESLGLPPNSLSIDASIKQGCKYFSELVKSIKASGYDINTAIQFYNFGGGFVSYVAGNGKKYSYELAESFSKDKSGKNKMGYPNPIAIPINGGSILKFLLIVAVSSKGVLPKWNQVTQNGTSSM